MNTTKLVMAYAIVILSLSVNLVYTQQQSAVCSQLQSSVIQLCNGDDRHSPIITGVPGKRGPKGEKGELSTVSLASLREQLASVQDENQRLKAELGETKEMCNNENQRLKAELGETKEMCNNKISGVEDKIQTLLSASSDEVRLKQCGLLQRPSKIEDSQFSSSSYWQNDVRGAPYQGRLFSTSGYGCWHANTNAGDQWIQVDLEQNYRIYAVATQGRFHDSYEQWVTSYSVSYKTEIGGSFRDVDDEAGAPVIFQGNTDKNTPVINDLPQPTNGRYFRINRLSYKGYNVIRFELLTC